MRRLGSRELLLQVRDRRPIATPVLRVAQRVTATAPVLVDMAEIPPGARVDRIATTPTDHPAGPHHANPALALLLVDSAVDMLPVPIVIPTHSESGGEIVERAIPWGYVQRKRTGAPLG